MHGIRTAALAGLLILSAGAVPALAQPAGPGHKAPTVTGLAGQGFEVKTAQRDALILQKGGEVYWCILHLGKTAPLNYVSECYSVR